MATQAKIQKVGVIGSGVMGSGIAAQIANAGIPVVLLDIKQDNGTNLAAKAIEKMMKADPAPFMHKRNAKLITCGNLEDDLDKLKDCDWIVEVVLEDIAVKHATYEKIAKYRKKDAVISSNTSTIPLEKLTEKSDKDFKQHFMVTHFFNPPRYMRLLEVVTGKDTDQKAAARVRDFCDRQLGKGVVVCHDTPGFIANRLGVYWLTAGINESIKQNVSVEARGCRDVETRGHSQNGRVRLAGFDRHRFDPQTGDVAFVHAAAKGCLPRAAYRPSLYP
jgi:3-hydroxyacyl-CoA dehydrogenase